MPAGIARFTASSVAIATHKRVAMHKRFTMLKSRIDYAYRIHFATSAKLGFLPYINIPTR